VGVCARRCSRHRLRDGAVEVSERRLLTPAGGKAPSPAARGCIIIGNTSPLDQKQTNISYGSLYSKIDYR
jgi:hypothetical protein